MLMTMDVGNTNLKFGLWEDNELFANWRVKSRSDISGDEVGFMLEGFLRLSGLSFSMIDDLVIASVVPPMRPSLERFAGKYLKKQAIFVESHSQKMMKLDYDNPREVGADRVVVSVAAWKRYRKSLVVVDFGTATTFDCVSGDGVYLGGAISPGFRLSADALTLRASLLPKLESFYVPTGAICKDTVNCMNSGLVLGYTSLVEGMVKRISLEMASNPTVVATGGLAALFASLSDSIDAVHPDLTMEGLKIIYDEKKW
ncbi:MAG: type III pantothenate kinase [Deltaproteobacteria bacterium]|jgi:type III pantothenate kinase|nr:type III pantothenate kinase [Deltaproteobacteria bacterium]